MQEYGVTIEFPEPPSDPSSNVVPFRNRITEDNESRQYDLDDEGAKLIVARITADRPAVVIDTHGDMTAYLIPAGQATELFYEDGSMLAKVCNYGSNNPDLDPIA